MRCKSWTHPMEEITKQFMQLKLSPQDHLHTLERAVCGKCGRRRKYFCYSCLIPMGDPTLAPHLTLPLEVDIIHHPTELVSKSTAIHAKIISSENVHIYEFPDFPDYHRDETLLLFPSQDSLTVKEIDFSSIKKVVFVDSQWQKTRKMMSDQRLSSLKCMKIDTQKTKFWRYQRFGENYLATIEAIYHFFKEYHTQKTGSYEGQYDDILYYYSLFYNLIQDHYKSTKKPFPRMENYVKEK